MSEFLPMTIVAALIILGLSLLLCLYRVIVGPTAQDRVMAFDLMNIEAVLIVLVLSIGFGSSMYFEIALLIALPGFLASTAMAKFLLRGEVIE